VVRGQKIEQMCGGEKYSSAIPYSTCDPPSKLQSAAKISPIPSKLQWYWTYLGLSVVPAQLIQKGASI